MRLLFIALLIISCGQKNEIWTNHMRGYNDHMGNIDVWLDPYSISYSDSVSFQDFGVQKIEFNNTQNVVQVRYINYINNTLETLVISNDYFWLNNEKYKITHK